MFSLLNHDEIGPRTTFFANGWMPGAASRYPRETEKRARLASAEANQMLAVAAAACDEKKAEDIRILALDPAESGLSDYFLICTGTNNRQTVAITDEIEIRLKREFGTYPNAVEGRRQGEWILMDYVDFIVHVFLPEKRAFYGLERLRPSATTLSVADLNAEIKAAIRSERSGKRKVTAAKPAGGVPGKSEAGESEDLVDDDPIDVEGAGESLGKDGVAAPRRKASATKASATKKDAVKSAAKSGAKSGAKRSPSKKAVAKGAKKVASPRQLAKGLSTKVTVSKASSKAAQKKPSKAASKAPSKAASKAPSKAARKPASKRAGSAE